MGTAFGALVGQMAMQVGVAAVTAMIGQLTHALCSTRTAPEKAPGGNGLYFDEDEHGTLTPVRPSRPPGMEEHRMDGSQEEAPSSISMDPFYDDDDGTPLEVRRDRTDAHVTDITGSLLQSGQSSRRGGAHHQ